jgi:HEAT repeat protein
MAQIATDNSASESCSQKEEQVRFILAQMAAILKNLKTYEKDHQILEKSFNSLQPAIFRFLEENESLTLLVREDSLVYGNVAVYECDNKVESLAFIFYRDGLRLISFLDGLTPQGLREFLAALHEARSADPYEADLVTILWEKDISGLRYRAVEAYLEDEEEKQIQEMVSGSTDHSGESYTGDLALGPAFFVNELGLSPRRGQTPPRRVAAAVTEEESGSIVQEIFQQDDHKLMKQCSEICLELVQCADSDDLFDNVVGFLGRICDWLVDWGDLISASSVLSELRTMVEKDDDASPRKATVLDTIARLGETDKIRRVTAYLADPDKARLDEVFAYLAMMEPVAVKPLFDILADSEVRDVRYMLCRVLSIVARHDTDRLRLYLLDKRWYVVRNAVTIMGMIGSVEAIPCIGLAAGHAEMRVRREAARALGRIGDPAALAVLADLVRDQKEEVRLEALQAIHKVGGAHAHSFIEECINDKALEKRSLEEKREIFRIYGSAGNASLNLLQEIVRGGVPGLRDETRAAAVYGIAEVGSGEARGILDQLKESAASELKTTVVEALSVMNERQEWE